MFHLGAQEDDSGPVGKNLLSLSNVISDLSGELGQTVHPMIFKTFTEYTLVVDEDYFDGTMNYAHIGELNVLSSNMSVCNFDIDADFKYDAQRRIGYSKIETLECSSLHIKNIPLPKTNNYNIVLIEGSINDFNGFEPYLAHDEVLVYEGFLAVDYDFLYETSQIKEFITAKTADGVILSYDTLIDTYTASSKLPGNYHMKFVVEHHNITKSLLLDIRVFDLRAPEILLPQNMEIPLAQKLSIEEIKSQIAVTDNVDELNAQDLIIISDNYSSANLVGTYEITMSISDSSGNVATETLSIQLIDRLGPVITGPKQIFLYTTDDVLTDLKIIQKFKAIDDVDGPNVSIIITDNQYLQTKVAGIYDVRLSSTDSNHNTTVHDIKIHVIENRGPEFFMSNLIMEATLKNQLTEQEIIDWFKNQAFTNGYEVSQVRVLLNEYKDNQKNQGSYYVYLSYDLDQETYTTRVTVDVDDDQTPQIIMPIAIGSALILIGVTVVFIIKKKK